MARIKGTFMSGWWNCFYSFAAETLTRFVNAEDACMSVLDAAGITRSEAQWQLEHAAFSSPRIERVIREYWLKCK